MSLTIHPDLQSLIPPLTPEESAQLEANLLEGGCRDPLVVWAEEQVVLDGHNRLAICERHDLPYPIQELSLPDLDAAKAWMIAHQLGRRNLTPDQMSYYRGKQYEMQKRQGKRTDLTSHHSDGKSQDTAQVLADQHKVGKATIERDGAYARAVDTIAAAVGPEARQAILARQTKVTQQDVKALAKIATQHAHTAKEALDAVQEVKTPKQARHIVRAKVREARDYEQYMDAMARSDGLASWPRHQEPPEVQQRAWDLVYVEELGRRLTKALDSLDRLHAHLVGDQDWLAVQLPALLEPQAALCIKLGECWGHMETLLLRSATVRQGLGRLPPAPAPDATLPPLGDGADPTCPPYDAAKFVLGKLCPRGHAWGQTGQSLLRKNGRYCSQCNTERKKARRQPPLEVPA
jgi:hypothetical protein